MKDGYSMENALRSIEVSSPIPNIKHGSKGYFHRWCDQPYYDSALDYPLRQTLALIEFVDGSVKFLEPEAIRFTEPYQKQ